MKRYIFLVVFVLCCAIPGRVFAIEGFPGKTWGELRWEHPQDGKENLILNGWVEQGVYWFGWGKHIKLNTYATLRYKWDSEELDWNNSIGPGVGIALEFFTPKGVYMRIGTEYIWDRMYRADLTEEKAVVYVGWYGWWDLKKR